MAKYKKLIIKEIYLNMDDMYIIDSLQCYNCYRIMPNDKFRRKRGCQWCVPE